MMRTLLTPLRTETIPLCLLCWALLFTPALPAQSGRMGAAELYRSGAEAQRAGDLFRAIDYYKEALRQNPDYVDPHRGLAEVFFRLGEYQEAQRYVTEARSLARMDTDIAALEGRIYTGLGEFDRAAQLFSRILRREPNNLDAQFGVAELEVARGRAQNALDVYLGALRSFPRNRRGLLSAAILYQSQGRYREAEDLLETAVRYYPNDPTAQAIAASHYYDTGDYAAAGRHAERALAEDPDNRRALNVIIDVLFAQERHEEVIPRIRRSLETSDDVLQRYALGKALAETGRIEAAERAFTAALRFRPDDEITRIVMEDALISQLPRDSAQRAEAAQERFQSARKYENANRTELARQEYRRGLELNPYSVRGRVDYAEVFKRAGDYGKYLSILRVVADEGNASQDIRDEIEIYESLTDETVASRWGVDQFAIERDMYSLALFADASGSSMRHVDSEEPLLQYVRTLMYGYEHLDILHTGEAEGFAAAFRAARQREVDYFLIFTFTEEESTFTVRAAVYHGTTGTLLAELETFRTGNDRVARASMRTVGDFQELLPVRGRIYRRDGDSVLIDLGRYQSVMPEDNLKVIRESDIDLESRSFGFEYNPEDVLGEVSVTESDELIAEGTLSSSSFFDLVNPTDVVFRPVSGEEEQQNGQEPESGDELNVNSSVIYKSLLQIR